MLFSLAPSHSLTGKLFTFSRKALSLRVVTSLNPDAEIRKRRVAITRTSSFNLWIRARGVCCQHLLWDSVRKFRSRLMKDEKPDEYATDEASNFQFADSP
uniref:Uncharacterized protein n=1 Tax=Caenorhabditis japonica TaxID=281687 RepID=A0A8R1IYL2_CAEJA